MEDETQMCLAVPGRIVEIEGANAKVDFGGVVRRVNVSLVDADVGDYVLVHVGFAIKVLEEGDAREILEMWEQILEAESHA